MSTTDNAAAAWLRQRHPRWSDAAVSWSIARSHVIDDHPDWNDAQVDREVGRRLGAGGKVKEED
jgi:hypothetical protein